MIRQGALADAKLFYYDLVRPESDRLRALCFDLFAINQAAMYNAEARTHAIANQTAFGTMIISVVSAGPERHRHRVHHQGRSSSPPRS